MPTYRAEYLVVHTLIHHLAVDDREELHPYNKDIHLEQIFKFQPLGVQFCFTTQKAVNIFIIRTHTGGVSQSAELDYLLWPWPKNWSASSET